MSEEDSNLSQDSYEYRRWKAVGTTEIVHLCPRGCKGSLVEQEGLLMCNECDGAKVSVEMLAEGTELLTGKHSVRDILLQFIRKGKESDLNCVLCNKKMCEVELQYNPNQVTDFEPLMGRFGRQVVGDGVSTEHPIFVLIGLTIMTGEIVNAASHVAKKSAASMKKKVTSTITLDGCASCESMWFDGKKYSSPTGSYNHEIEILERFWTSTEKSEAINRLDEKKAEDDTVNLLEKEREKKRNEKEARKKEEARRAALTPEQRQTEDDKKDDNRPYWQRYDNL